MKYVITGASGNISKPLSEKLLNAGHQVTVIGRNADHLKELVDKGAQPAIGSVDDVDFLIKTFAGADAVYIMVPPNIKVANWKNYIAQMGGNYAKAIEANRVGHVVNLSSIGAHMADGCGPVSGLYHVEQTLNALADANIKHLRPGYFYQNLLGNIGLIKSLGIMGGNFGGPGSKLVLSNTDDIADVAADELIHLYFAGKTVRYMASDEKNGDEIARIVGAAIGKPDLHWAVFDDQQALLGMLQAGLPEEIAKNYVEMGHAIRTGEMTADYWKHHPGHLGKRKLEDFANLFAAIYNGQGAPVHG